MVDLNVEVIHFDLSINTELSALFLELLSTYVAVFVIFCKFEERKMVAGLYEATHQALKGTGNAFFPRLSRMIADWKNPFKMLPVDSTFTNCERIMKAALLQTGAVLMARMVPAQTMRDELFLNITDVSADLHKPVAGKFAHLRFTSLISLVRWVSFGFLLFPALLLEAPEPNSLAPVELLKLVLAEGILVQLFRDVSVNVFVMFEDMISAKKEMKKLKSDLKLQLAFAKEKALEVHASRRQYLRQELRTLVHVFTDKSVLIGPKAAVVLSALSMVRDEVMWLFTHRMNTPSDLSKMGRLLEDPELPYLLSLATQLGALVRDNEPLIRQYHAEFLAGFDLATLREAVVPIGFGEGEQQIFASIMEQLGALPTATTIDLSGLRLDIMRLQAMLSGQHSSNDLFQHPAVAASLNLIGFHSSLVDEVVPFMQRVGGLGELLYFRDGGRDLMDVEFEAARQNPTQYRSLMAFPLVCRSHPYFGSERVPGEKEMTIAYARDKFDGYCITMARQILFVVNQISKREAALRDEMVPAEAVGSYIAGQRGKGGVPTTVKKGSALLEVKGIPGAESVVHKGDLIEPLRVERQALSDFCWALNHFEVVHVHNYTFIPKVYLRDVIEKFFKEQIQERLEVKGHEPLVRPTELWTFIETLMGTVRDLESFIEIDTHELFSRILRDQALIDGVREHSTAGATYSQFYLKLLIEDVPAGGICASTSLKAFVTLGSGVRHSFRAEDYTDLSELEALCLLIGPYGIKQIDDALLKSISTDVQTMKGLVVANKLGLDTLRNKTEQIQSCLDALGRMEGLDEFTQCGTRIGTVLIFRKMFYGALQSVLERRIPFIHQFIRDLHQYAETTQWDSLAQATGLHCSVDPGVLKVVEMHCTAKESDRAIWNNMMSMSAASLWQLAYNPGTVFNAELDAHENNAHALSLTIASLSSAAFTLMAETEAKTEESIEAAQAEFLRIASVCLLRLGNKASRGSRDPTNRDSAYVILDRLVSDSDFITADALEKYFPYSLVRTSLHEVYKTAESTKKGSFFKR
jgi:NCK-associated protein 1